MRAKSAIKEIKNKIEQYERLKEADEKYWNNQISGLKTALMILETPDDDEQETSKIDVLTKQKEN